jgi:hypothetical protein
MRRFSEHRGRFFWDHMGVLGMYETCCRPRTGQVLCELEACAECEMRFTCIIQRPQIFDVSRRVCISKQLCVDRASYDVQGEWARLRKPGWCIFLLCGNKIARPAKARALTWRNNIIAQNHEVPQRIL